LYQQVACYCGEPGVKVLQAKPRLTALEYLSTYLQLVNWLRAARPDAVIGFLPLGNVMGLSAAALAGIGTRIASQRSPGTTFSAPMRLFDRILGSCGAYSAVVCVSTAVRDSFERYPDAYRSRLSVVNNGIEWTQSAMDRASARASFAIPADMPLFVATGRFTAQKNYSLMVRAAAATSRIRLAIAGDGPQRREMQELAAVLRANDRIHFLGNLTRTRVCDLLRAADAFVQSSLYEGQSNSTLEAMHEGLPIICSDIVMQRETVCEEGAEPVALLVPLDDFQGWTKALALVRDDRTLSERLGRSARALVERRFTLQKMIDGFERVLLDVEAARWKQRETNCVAGRADFIR
jgi:glycosyltransferase involved in cell wall biosynthesis